MIYQQINQSNINIYINIIEFNEGNEYKQIDIWDQAKNYLFKD